MGQCILLIDDDEDEEIFFNEVLKELQTDIYCVHASNADDGLKKMKEISPMIVFLDFNMPKKDGISCLHEIRQIADLDHIPVILYSNGVDDVLSQKALAAGANSCVKKPIRFKVLYDLLQSILVDGRIDSP